MAMMKATQAGTTARQRVRARLGEYPRPLWWLALANLLLWTGRGMIVPFLVIFFSQVVGLSGSVVGAGIAAANLLGIAFVMLMAGQIDRRGGHLMLVSCLGLMAVSTALHGEATSVLPFLLVTLGLNFGGQLFWPSLNVTVASLTETERVAEGMSLMQIAFAVGIGAGGLLGGALVSGGELAQYRVLFLVSGGLIAASALTARLRVPSIALHSQTADGGYGRWSDVLADRVFVAWLCVLFTLICGWTQVQISVPPFLREEAGIGERTIGALFALNTVVVVLTQIPMTRVVARSRLSVILLAIGGCWSLAFLGVLATLRWAEPAAAGAFLVFGAGQVLLVPLTTVVAVRLAPAHLRGRYFSLSNVVWGFAWAVAALFGGVMLDTARPELLWPIVIVLMLTGGLAGAHVARAPRLRATA